MLGAGNQVGNQQTQTVPVYANGTAMNLALRFRFWGMETDHGSSMTPFPFRDLGLNVLSWIHSLETDLNGFDLKHIFFKLKLTQRAVSATIRFVFFHHFANPRWCGPVLPRAKDHAVRVDKLLHLKTDVLSFNKVCFILPTHWCQSYYYNITKLNPTNMSVCFF